MNGYNSIQSAALATLLAGLLACGEGVEGLDTVRNDGGGNGDGGNGGSEEQTDVAFGVITRLGSLVVNGIHYDTSGATILVGGEPAAEQALDVGMVVAVEGELDPGGGTGTASRVIFENELEAPVDGIDTAGRIISILNQTVHYSADTVFVGTSPEIISPGEIIEVSGFRQDDGIIEATRVEFKDATFNAGDVIEVKGPITSVDPPNQEFSLGSLTVDYANAVLNDLSAGELTAGRFVAVQTDEALSPILHATVVEAEDDTPAVANAARLSIAGPVGGNVNDGWTVNGIPLLIDGGTAFAHGGQGDLTAGAMVVAEGAMDTAGLRTETLTFRASGELALQGTIEAVDSGNDTLVVLGQTIEVTAQTLMRDDSGFNDRSFDLTDLAQGDAVEVQAYGQDDRLVASRIHREDQVTSGVEGVVGSVDPFDNRLTVGGVTVVVAGAQLFDRNGNGLIIGEFFSRLTAGATRVEAQGDYVAAELAADRVEIDD